MWRQCVNTAVLCDTTTSLLVAVHYSILANKHTDVKNLCIYADWYLAKVQPQTLVSASSLTPPCFDQYNAAFPKFKPHHYANY